MNRHPLDRRSRWRLQHAGWGLGVLLLIAACRPKPPAHGTEFVVEVVGEEWATDEAVGLAGDVLRSRLKGLGVPAFAGGDSAGHVVIQVPELEPELLELARQIITRRWLLEFRRVVAMADANHQGEWDKPVGAELMTYEGTSRHGGFVERLWVDRRPDLTGRDVKSAEPTRDPSGSWLVQVSFNTEGARRFGDLTSAMVDMERSTGQRQRLAIVLDGRVQSAPAVLEPITGGVAAITGTFTDREALELANVLNNPLDVPLRLVDERRF